MIGLNPRRFFFEGIRTITAEASESNTWSLEEARSGLESLVHRALQGEIQRIVLPEGLCVVVSAEQTIDVERLRRFLTGRDRTGDAPGADEIDD